MKTKTLRHNFVKYMPETLDEGVLYISVDYCTAIHNCVCGCGNRVVTPITPTDWELAFNGETVSLSPSIGNWSFKCQSHYWIKRGKVKWAGQWSKEEIDAGRQKDRINKASYLNYIDQPSEGSVVSKTIIVQQKTVRSFWQSLRQKFGF